jgi:hypothetical protein
MPLTVANPAVYAALENKKPAPWKPDVPPTDTEIADIPVAMLSYRQHIGILFRTPPDYSINR